MAELFQKAKSTINEHINNIYEEGELKKEDTGCIHSEESNLGFGLVGY